MSAAKVTILGGGPVGLATALSLNGILGRDAVRIVEAGVLPEYSAVDAPLDLRVYALSPATRRLLESLNVWSRLRTQRIAPVTGMEVRGDRPEGVLDLGLREPLAWIVEHRELTSALASRVREEEIEVIEKARAVEWIAPAKAGGVSRLRLEDRMLEQPLIIGADGAHSWLRSQAGLMTQSKDYDSLGVVANFRSRRPHQGIARQWFRGSDVLAWLPLPDDRISIVWSVSRAEGERLAALPAAELAAEVARAGGAAEDALESISATAAFPLRRILAPVSVAEGLMLIGDAAHAFHPLAGQGVNLGFGDVSCLGDALRDRSRLQGLGNLALLRRVERARREEVLSMAVLTDRLKALFESRSDSLARLRNEGMAWVNRQSAVKHAMMRAAMG